MYDARIGRFLSIDPGFMTFPSIAPYAAYLNNPVFLLDPNGNTVYDANGNPIELYRDQNGTVIGYDQNIDPGSGEMVNALISSDVGREILNILDADDVYVQFILSDKTGYKFIQGLYN